MAVFQNDKKLAILTDNLNICKKREKCDTEQKSICLEEISSLLCDEYKNSDPLSVMEKFRAINPDCSLEDSIFICSSLISHPSFADAVRTSASVGHNEPTPPGSHSKVAYTKNKYNDEAFEIFSSEISGAKVHYTASMSDACEAVTEGSCEFCILPIRNILDGRLWGFYYMLDRYGLKIRATCNIDAIDGTSSTDYALIGRFCPEPAERHKNRTKLIYEFSILSENGDFLADILAAARACRSTLLFIDSRPVEYDVQLCRYVFSFQVEAENSLLFRTLIATRYESYSPIGLYYQN